MKNNKRLLIAFIVASPCYANDPFTDLDQEMQVYQSNADLIQLEDEFQQYISEFDNDYKRWHLQYLQEFDVFQAELINKWGEGDSSWGERDVQFSDNNNVKSVVDYQNEKVTVAMLVDKNLSVSESETVARLKIGALLADKNSNLAELFAQKEMAQGGTFSFAPVQFSQEKKEQAQSLIVKQTQAQAQQIDKQADRALLSDSELTESESSLLATQEKMELLKLSQERLMNVASGYEQAQSTSENDKQIVLYEVNIPKNGLATRAEKYASFAEKEGQIRSIPASLVMAIMHTESAFNPNAKSAVPAYGLMQIVPRTAGHDVNKLMRNIDKPMNKSDLYIPAVNVETGTAYLDILDKRYLKAIKNKQSRLYCTIASYNTGAGNVARVFNENSSRNINKAAKVINRLTAEQVYEQLMAKLPYDETKHYLQRVNSRIALYQIDNL